MPDISKCKNETCVKKNQCYRFTCIPSEFGQSWGDFEPSFNRKRYFGCNYFMKIPKK